jgi:ABC-type phosphate transport system permease subunit
MDSVSSWLILILVCAIYHLKSLKYSTNNKTKNLLLSDTWQCSESAESKYGTEDLTTGTAPDEEYTSEWITSDHITGITCHNWV